MARKQTNAEIEVIHLLRVIKKDVNAIVSDVAAIREEVREIRAEQQLLAQAKAIEKELGIR